MEKIKNMMLKSQSLKQEPFINIPGSSEISKIENSERISINQQRRQSIKFDFFAGFSPSSRGGVAKAFFEYQRTSKFKFIDFYRIDWRGKAFLAVPSDYEDFSLQLN